MNPRLLLCLSLAALPAAGCFRVSDPIYAFRGLGADEPESPESSLVFGSVEISGVFNSIDTIQLRRVSPHRDEPYLVGATEQKVFRLFRTREMKNGHFLIQVPPGVYELEGLRGGMWGQDARFYMDDGSRASTRLTITRPGVYDMGRLKIEPAMFTGRGTLTWGGRGGADREQLLRDAVAGTAWARYLGEGG